MKKNIKSISLLLLILLIPFIATGCAKNQSAKSVAMDMVNRLSSGNYKNIGEIIYMEDGAYVSDEVFKQLMIDKKLDLQGNKKVKFIRQEGEITDHSTGKITNKVVLAMDGNRQLVINTIKVNKKWYVYDPTFFDGNITIKVPKGTKVKFDGKELGKKFLKTEKVTEKVKHPNYTLRNVEVKDAELDVYTIKNVVKGKYNISVKLGKSNEIKDVISTYGTSADKSGNYTRKITFEANVKNADYTFKIVENENEIKEFINEYHNAIYSNAATGGFEGVEKYFDTNMKNYNSVKTNYESLAKRCKQENNSTYYSDFKIDKMDFSDIIYYDDNNIVVATEYTVKYKINSSSRTTDRTTNLTKSIMLLKKTGKGNYVIMESSNPFVY